MCKSTNLHWNFTFFLNAAGDLLKRLNPSGNNTFLGDENTYQKSLKQRDYSEKRTSKTAEEFIKSNNINIPNDYGEKKLFFISAMEDALDENPSSDYEKMIRLYFLNLQKESIENENK